MRRYYPALIAVLVALVPCPAGRAAPLVTDVINIPPGPAIGNHESIGSNTTLNLFEGGTIGISFDAGAASGTENIEVNIHGGTVGNQFFAGHGSVVNLLGGNPLGLFAGGAGSVVNIAGGGIGPLSGLWGDAILNVYSGSLGNSFSARFESAVNIYGGVIERGFTASSDSVVNIYGGTFHNDFNAVQNSSVHIFGRSFFFERTDIAEGLTVGVPRTVTFRDGRLHGTLADGALFGFDLNSGINFLNQDFFARTVTLTITLVPEPTTLVLALSSLLCIGRPRRGHRGKPTAVARR